jgi:hypothetical protein
MVLNPKRGVPEPEVLQPVNISRRDSKNSVKWLVSGETQVNPNGDLINETPLNTLTMAQILELSCRHEQGETATLPSVEQTLHGDATEVNTLPVSEEDNTLLVNSVESGRLPSAT